MEVFVCERDWCGPMTLTFRKSPRVQKGTSGEGSERQLLFTPHTLGLKKRGVGVLGGQKGGSQCALFPDLFRLPKEDDVVIEDFEEDSEAEGSGGEDDIRELRAKKLALARKIAEQQRRQEKIQVGPPWGGWLPSGRCWAGQEGT